MAAETIEKESRGGDQAKLVQEQLQRILPQLKKSFRLQACRAFDRVVLASGEVLPIEEKYQVSDEQILQKAQGQAVLRKFLDDKRLIYQPADALDTDRFVEELLKGATPTDTDPDVWTTKAIHERVLAARNLRLLPDGAVVRQSILRAVRDGRLVVRLPDDRVYDADGAVDGPPGSRRRMRGSSLTTVPLDSETMVARADSAAAKAWLEVAEGPEPDVPTPHEVDEDSEIRVTDWNELTGKAATRPLLELKLHASDPETAGRLASLAQPLGANRVALEVTTGGTSGDGTIQFGAYNVGLNHPARPLELARAVHKALGGSLPFNAKLTLRFGDGRSDMQDRLDDLRSKAPEGLEVIGRFGPAARSEP